MPVRLLPVKHIPQEEPAGCLAACAQMALQYLGLLKSQPELNRLFGTTPAGTPRSRLDRLSRFGMSVETLLGNAMSLSQMIDADLPVIAFVRTGQLTSYWRTDAQHALLVVGYDEESLFVNDPAFQSAPIQILWDEFVLAWLEMDYVMSVIRRA